MFVSEIAFKMKTIILPLNSLQKKHNELRQYFFIDHQAGFNDDRTGDADANVVI